MIIGLLGGGGQQSDRGTAGKQKGDCRAGGGVSKRHRSKQKKATPEKQAKKLIRNSDCCKNGEEGEGERRGKQDLEEEGVKPKPGAKKLPE